MYKCEILLYFSSVVKTVVGIKGLDKKSHQKEPFSGQTMIIEPFISSSLCSVNIP